MLSLTLKAVEPELESSPSGSPRSPGKSRYVKLCTNCNHSFRCELKPFEDFCSKDCETSYFWFKKRPSSTVAAPVVVEPSQLFASTSNDTVQLAYQDKKYSLDSESTQLSNGSDMESSSIIEDETNSDSDNNNSPKIARKKNVMDLFRQFKRVFHNQDL